MLSVSQAPTPVNLHDPQNPVRRFGAALALLLALGAVMTTVSVLGARQLGSSEEGAAGRPAQIDTLAPVRQTLRLLDEARGLEALHLVVPSPARKRALEADLAAQRREIDALLAQTPSLAGDTTDRQLGATVRADAAAYWAVQEQLLAQSRRSPDDPHAAESAQQLLGASQALFDRLRDHIDAWWTHREARAREAVQALRAQAAQSLWAIALLGLAALGAGIALALRRSPPPASVAAAVADDAEPASPGRVEQFQALIDAVRTAPATPQTPPTAVTAATD